jgi:hypothetical protein
MVLQRPEIHHAKAAAVLRVAVIRWVYSILKRRNMHFFSYNLHSGKNFCPSAAASCCPASLSVPDMRNSLVRSINSHLLVRHARELDIQYVCMELDDGGAAPPRFSVAHTWSSVSPTNVHHYIFELFDMFYFLSFSDTDSVFLVSPPHPTAFGSVRSNISYRDSLSLIENFVSSHRSIDGRLLQTRYVPCSHFFTCSVSFLSLCTVHCILEDLFSLGEWHSSPSLSSLVDMQLLLSVVFVLEEPTSPPLELLLDEVNFLDSSCRFLSFK